MHPKFAGDPHDIAKLSIMDWLDPNARWLIHPMYFPLRGEILDDEFPGRIAQSLRANLVTGDIWQRPKLVNAVAVGTGHLFLDPDTGVLLDNAVARRKDTHLHVAPLNAYVRVCEVVAAARYPLRAERLVLVYDVSFDNNPKRPDPDGELKGQAGQQLRKKLNRIREAEGERVHAAAYIAHNQGVAFIWASTDCELVSNATRRLMTASRLPDCCFVDDGCGHVPPHP